MLPIVNKENPPKKNGCTTQFELVHTFDGSRIGVKNDITCMETIPLPIEGGCLVALAGGLKSGGKGIIIFNLETGLVIRLIELIQFTNQMFYHPYVNKLLFEERSKLYETKIEGTGRKEVHGDFANTGNASSCSTCIIGMLTKELIVFPLGDQKTLCVFDLLQRKRVQTFNVEYNDVRTINTPPLEESGKKRKKVFYVGGYKNFYVFEFDDETYDVHQLCASQGSRYGFVYNIGIVNNRFLVTGSNSGECNVFIGFRDQKTVKRLFQTEQSYNNGTTSSFEFKNILVVGSRDGAKVKILEFLPHLRMEEEVEEREILEKTTWGIYELEIGENKRRMYENRRSENKKIIANWEGLTDSLSFCRWADPRRKRRLITANPSGEILVWRNNYKDSFTQSDQSSEDEKERVEYLHECLFNRDEEEVASRNFNFLEGSRELVLFKVNFLGRSGKIFFVYFKSFLL